jgi:methylase of polypeptide subunit release factors
LDIFSGSGCIGISLLSHFSNIKQMDFVDIWPAALKQIKLNLALNKIKESRYKIYRSDLFNKLKGKKYDFIFANPPYVALNRISEVQDEFLKTIRP